MRVVEKRRIADEGYIYDNIRIGEVVGWIFNNEQDGYRIKYGHRIK